MMKVLVAVKRVVDYTVKVHTKPDGSDVDIANVKMSMNPFDEIAVEQAIRIKEAGQANEVVLVSIGDSKSAETLRHGLALGADRAILVTTASSRTEPLGIAKALQAVVERESPNLVLLGKQAIDDDCNQTAQMLAALLDWPQATFASEIGVDGDRATVVREIDGGLETIACQLPCIISVDLRLNEPRYATLPNIMKSKQKPLEQLTAEELKPGLEEQLSPRLKLLNVAPPPQRQAGEMVNSVDELVSKLAAAKVI